MRKFNFRLETLLQLRISEAEEAKLIYFHAQKSRYEMEDYLAELSLTRRESLGHPAQDFSTRFALQAWMDSLDLQQQQAESALMVLLDEEEGCRQVWLDRQQAADVLAKLRERHAFDHELEMSRWEQAQLDEWAVMRRSA